MTIRTWWFISPLPVFLIPSLNRSTIHVSWDQNPTSQSSSQSERQKQQQKTTTSFWDFETIVSQQINHWRYLLRLHPSTTQSNNQPFTLLPMTLVRPVIQPLMFTSIPSVNQPLTFTSIPPVKQSIHDQTHCVRHLLHVRRVNHPGMDPALRVKRQQNLQSSVTAFLRCAAKCAREEVSPIFSTIIIRCIYVSCLSIDKDKQETKNTFT